MQKNIVLPNKEDLMKIMVGVDPDFELVSHLYPIISDKLDGKEFSKGEIDKIVSTEIKTYIYSTTSSESVASWLENIGNDIIDEVTKN